MTKTKTLFRLTLGTVALVVCLSNLHLKAQTFGEDLAFVKGLTPVVVLSNSEGARVLVAPALQARVLTSGISDQGTSFGWINREFFASGKTVPHINVYGGEDRFWIGPEGGQFSIFFAPQSPFDLAHWQTPAPIDTEPFDVVSQVSAQATFEKKFTLTNYSGTTFEVKAERQVILLSSAQTWAKLNLAPGRDVKSVCYETINRLTNIGERPWDKSSGLLSIWILGQYNATPHTTVLVPYQQGDEAVLGKVVESGYFGRVPPDRLRAKDGLITFKADGKFRSKIGVNPKRSLGLLGSYDSAGKVLTIVQFNQPVGQTDYVNSQWKIQADAFNGDAANSYNDGPNELGKALGNFYELESSSPAAALSHNKTIDHLRWTTHLTGNEQDLDLIAYQLFKVHLKDLGKN